MRLHSNESNHLPAVLSHLVLCDDHPMVADGIAVLLRSVSPELRVSQYYDAQNLLQNASGWDDVCLVMLDLALPDTESGSDTLRTLRSLRPDLPVVIISGASDMRTVMQTLDNGAMGFIPKSYTTPQLLEAMKQVLSGNVHLPAGYGIHDGTHIPPPPSFTKRQWQVLYQIIQGKSIKHIATNLYISENTVKSHVSQILGELGCSTRTQAVVCVHERNLKFPPEALELACATRSASLGTGNGGS